MSMPPLLAISRLPLLATSMPPLLTVSMLPPACCSVNTLLLVVSMPPGSCTLCRHTWPLHALTPLAPACHINAPSASTCVSSRVFLHTFFTNNPSSILLASACIDTLTAYTPAPPPAHCVDAAPCSLHHCSPPCLLHHCPPCLLCQHCPLLIVLTHPAPTPVLVDAPPHACLHCPLPNVS
jgi:hypothetical protein